MQSADLGTLEQVQVREAWPSEAVDFTPWLASEAGLRLLGSTIGFNLELDSVEKPVGPFRADILAKRADLAEHWVLIENQLESTDHRHLGQLLAYAAGLKAATIIWVASELRDEHRAALDWLNDITREEFEFYGLEIQLWRIGASALAPRLNIVCRPNDFQRVARQAILESEDTSSRKQMHLEYWSKLHERLRQQSQRVKPQKAHPQNYSTFSLGRTHFELAAASMAKDDEIGVYVILRGPWHATWFKQLLEQRAEIERELSATLEWRELRGDKSSSIVLLRPHSDPEDRDDWPAQHEWLASTLDRFDQVFRSRIARLPNPASKADGMSASVVTDMLPG